MKFRTLATTALAGCLLAFTAQANELRIALQDDPDMLDPAQSRSFLGRIVYTAMCDKLVDVNENVEFVPMLATDWATSDDGLKLVLNLREGVKFHDGETLDAESVVYTINRNLTLPESRRKSELASVEKVEATGPLQVTFTLKSPDSSLLAQLSDRAGIIVSPKAAEAAGANFGQHPVCAGPYKFVERVAQDRIVVEKFAEYYDADRIHIDKVTYIPIPDSTVRLANLRSGDVQLVDRIAATDVEIVKGDASLGYAEAIGLGSMGMYVNVSDNDLAKGPVGQDKRVRQAFSLAIDRDAIAQVVFAGTAVAGNQPWPPNSPWYNKDIPVQPRDIEKAKALMAEAGLDRISFPVQHNNNPVVTQAMQMIQAMVAEAGFDIELRSTEFATLLNEQAAKNYVISRSDWSGRPDPDGNTHQFYTSTGGQNETGYNNPEVDRLLNEAREAADPAVRKQKYDEFAKIITDELPIITIGHQSYLYGFSAKLEGFKAYPDAMIRLQDLKLAE